MTMPQAPSARWQAAEFLLTARPAADFKVTVVVSKKVAAKAVERNRIRRIVTEALKSLNLNHGQITVVVKKNLANLKSWQVRDKLVAIYGRKNS